MRHEHALHPPVQGRYGFTRQLDLPFAQAVAHMRQALAREGFGVLFEVDLAEKLKEKLGASLRPYVVLGVCAPALALEGLEQDHDLGLLMPCHAVVYEDDSGRSVVGAIDAGRLMGFIGNPGLVHVAEQIDERLRRVVGSL